MLKKQYKSETMNEAMAIYKKDWKEAEERMKSWWDNQKTDRVPAYLCSPKSFRTNKAKTIKKLPEKMIDPDTIFHNLDIRLENTFWGGEAFPCHEVYMGAMFEAAWFGCEPHFTPTGTWYQKLFNSWDEADKVLFDPQNKWYRLFMEIRKKSVERAHGRYLVTVSGISASYDLFAELFGVKETMLEIVDYPQRVLKLRDKIIRLGKLTYDECYNLLASYQDGSIDGMCTWAPGRVRYVQCDMSVMISPKMFNDFVLEEIKAFMEHVDYGIYHLDGDDQIKHLNLLLTIDSLKMIQFVPVPLPEEKYYRDPLPWVDLFTKIQESGKKVWIQCPPDIERIKELLNKIPRDNAFLYIICPDEKTVQQVLSELDKIGT